MEAARTFVHSVRDEDSLAVMTFADRPVFAHDLMTTREWSIEAIDDYIPIGGTALYDTVVDSLTRLRRVEGRKGDCPAHRWPGRGQPGTGPGSVHTLADALSRLRAVDATIFCIGLGPNIDPETLKSLAIDSGGDVYFPQDVSTLADDYRRILENIRRQHVITYTSTNSARDGEWRHVEIRTDMSGTIVNSRGGYFAPEQQSGDQREILPNVVYDP